MTIREFLEVIKDDKLITVCEQEKNILTIDTRVKEELLDREIEEKGVSILSNYSLEIRIK